MGYSQCHTYHIFLYIKYFLTLTVTVPDQSACEALVRVLYHVIIPFHRQAQPKKGLMVQAPIIEVRF